MKTFSRYILLVIGFLFFSVTFQNCSKAKFTGVTQSDFSSSCAPGSAGCPGSLSTYSCQGTTPPNADRCNTIETDLTKNLNRSLVSSCSASGRCEYACAKNYVLSNNVCVPNALVKVCQGVVPANSTLCSGDDSNLLINAPRIVTNACSATKCEYTCNPGFPNVNGVCTAPPSGCTGQPVLTQNVNCPAGQQGSLTQTRTMQNSQCLVSNTNYVYTYSAWSTTSNTCFTPVSCNGTADVPTFGTLPKVVSGNSCICDISATSLSTAALTAKGLYEPIYNVALKTTTVVDSIGHVNATERARHTLVFSAGNTCDLKCQDPDMALSTDTNGKIICSSCKIPALVKNTRGGQTSISTAYSGVANVPSYLKNNTTKECFYSASGFDANITSGAKLEVTTKTMAEVTAVVKCAVMPQHCDTNTVDTYVIDTSSKERCSYGYTEYCRTDDYKVLGKRSDTTCYQTNLNVYQTYPGGATSPATASTKPDAYYFSCESQTDYYCQGLGCNYGFGGGSTPGSGSGGGFQ